MPALLQPEGLQKPKTPNWTLSKLPSGMAEMMGADITERSSSAKAIPSSTDKGVAGRSMLAVDSSRRRLGDAR